MRVLILPVLSFALSGCVVAAVANTAVDVVTLPVKAVSAGVDAATTSQSEADEKRGREIRKAEEAAGKEARAREKRCREGKPLPADKCSALPPS
jgi:isocitrate lyase